MKQNIYDNPDFLGKYIPLRENPSGVNRKLEVPAMRSLLPEFLGKRVLDLGCGTGELSSLAVTGGAKSVVAVDISSNMISLARKRDTTGAVEFLVMPVEEFEADPASFDLVMSSLMLHYVADISGIIRRIAAWIEPGGHFVFSTEHPILTAAQGIHNGWVRDDNGNKVCWPVDQYASEGMRKSKWFIDGVIKYHRSFSTIINTLVEHGFVVERICEPFPSPGDVEETPELHDETRRPVFLLVRARKA